MGHEPTQKPPRVADMVGLYGPDPSGADSVEVVRAMRDGREPRSSVDREAAAPLRVLTVRQPWAGLIAAGIKDVENRATNVAGAYRGPVAIHAGLSQDHRAWDQRRVTEAMEGIVSYRLGAIVAVVDLIDVRDERAPLAGYVNMGWADAGYWQLRLANARPLKVPVQWTGRLGLTRLPDDVAERVWAQVPGEAVA